MEGAGGGSHQPYVSVPSPVQYHRPRAGLGTFVPPSANAADGHSHPQAFQTYGEYWQAGQPPDAFDVMVRKTVKASSSFWPFGSQITQAGFDVPRRERPPQLATLADVHPPRSPVLRHAGSQTVLLGSFEEHTRKHKRYPL
mmetsp:Transcript_23544/g.54836  ORF Transcript_23544/g.54836 Transcript_23544/m.54836 type:complete len:141 (+) Transcript_23544:98-520(+)